MDGGFYVTPAPTVIDDGVTSTGSSLEFFSGNLFYLGGAGLTLTTSLGTTTVIGPRLYSGTSSAPTFLTGTFNLKDFYGTGNPYLLTITPEAGGVTPEISTLWMVASGGLAVLPVDRWRRRRAAGV